MSIGDSSPQTPHSVIHINERIISVDRFGHHRRRQNLSLSALELAFGTTIAEDLCSAALYCQIGLRDGIGRHAGLGVRTHKACSSQCRVL